MLGAEESDIIIIYFPIRKHSLWKRDCISDAEYEKKFKYFSTDSVEPVFGRTVCIERERKKRRKEF